MGSLVNFTGWYTEFVTFGQSQEFHYVAAYSGPATQTKSWPEINKDISQNIETIL